MLEHEQKNVWKMIGMRIRRERIKRNWSQSGLCYGICAVSYLSKIEQGKMEVSEEILKLLLERLELPWIDDKETKDLESFVEAQYEFLFTHPIQEFLKQKEIFQEKKEKLYSSSLIADACILEAVYESRKDEIEEGLERYLDFRQLAVLRMLQGRLDEAIKFRLCICGQGRFFMRQARITHQLFLICKWAIIWQPRKGWRC